MPVKRRGSKAHSHRITPEVIEAYQAGDYIRLHRALGLKPWEMSPLPTSVTSLGVSEHPPAGSPVGGWDASWGKAKELQRAILAEIGAADG
jgi:hypothetical protein